MIQELKLENCIFRFPFVNEVEKYYAAADVIVAPFVIQHFSLAVIEAGAMKKPVIGSRIGGIEEMIEDGKNGFLVQPNDENDMAEKILNLFDHPKLASEMGKKGYYQALELCSADTYALKVMTLYEKIYERCACDGN
jgi:glycosyltransferase involved in cell wall biosynthesis